MDDFRIKDIVYFNPSDRSCDIVRGRIIDFGFSYRFNQEYALVRFGSEEEFRIPIKQLYHTKGQAKEALKQEFRISVNEVKKDIHTLEELLKYMYNNDVSRDEDDDYTTWHDRVAVRELAKEICGIELGE